MNELTTVANLIYKLIGIAVAVGFIDAAINRNVETKTSASNAIQKSQMSYSNWNKRLFDGK